jgi:hypothetical protein
MGHPAGFTLTGRIRRRKGTGPGGGGPIPQAAGTPELLDEPSEPVGSGEVRRALLATLMHLPFVALGAEK